MTREERSPVYAKAIDTFGIPAQLQMVIEEMSELTKELCKFSRGKEVRSQIAEETADVLVCLDQLMMIFGIRDEVEAQMDRKVLRLAQRLHMQVSPEPAPLTCDPIDRRQLSPGQEVWIVTPDYREHSVTFEDATVEVVGLHSFCLKHNGLTSIMRWEDLGETVFLSFEAAQQRLQELREEV
ncbi:MAG: hypothetical protein IK095_03355 [Oscillospiraceae bacterium]|nr:hypothetical protein [Oscillospiraceae bacterium]